MAIDAKKSARTIVILKATPAPLRGSETFLANRGWIVRSTASLRDAITLVITERPRFMLLCADHSNKKIQLLPKLISEAFKINIIAYTELDDNTGVAKLQELEVDHCMYPPISGPAVNRMLLRILKEEKDEAKDLAETEKVKAAANLDQSAQNARDALSAILKDSEEKIPAASENSTSEAPVEVQSGDETSPLFASGSVDDFGNEVSEQLDPLNQPEENAADTMEPSFGDLKSQTEQAPAFAAKDNLADTEVRGVDSEDAPAERFSKARKSESTFVRGQRPVKEKIALITEATQKALDETAVKISKKGQAIGKVETVNNIACIVIETASFSGYLIAALGKNRSLDEIFMESVRKKLFNFLKAHGEIPDQEIETKAMTLKIQDIEFEDWALEQAEFLKKSIHGADADEVAMAFFPNDNTKIKLEASVSEKMLKLNVDEIREDTELEFDLYIYMPENKKYLLYTQQGMRLYENQKGRLKDKGITHIHLRKESAGAVKRYRAQNFLNEKISRFKKPKSA
jgi:hypothetical protein